MTQKLSGFIGPAYTLSSSNVNIQRCLNLYPEIVENANPKAGQRYYLRSTPGLDEILDLGTGPIRAVHRGIFDRGFVVSGNTLYKIAYNVGWTFEPVTYFDDSAIDQSADINTTTDVVTVSADDYPTGLKVQVSSTTTLPTGLVASTDYWLINVTATSVKIASTLANALAGTQIDITGLGSGTMTITAQDPTKITGAVGDSTDNDFTKTAHGFFDGLEVQIKFLQSSSGGLLANTSYYVIKTDANKFQLATTMANAGAGTAIVLSTISGKWFYLNYSATLNTSTGIVKAATTDVDSVVQDDSATMFVDGGDIYLFWDNSGTESFGELSTFGFGVPTDPTDITWVDGYFIVTLANSGTFMASDLGSFNFNALSYAASEGDPDQVIGLIANHRDLWVFNERSTEVFVNTGNPDFPFERIQGGFIEEGCAALGSISKVKGAIFWLGRDKAGQNIVNMSQGTSSKRISTHAIETAIAGYADITTATSYTYHELGQVFYVLNFAEATWVYSLTNRLWHERGFTTNGIVGRHLGSHADFFTDAKQVVVGHYNDGKVYVFNKDTYTDGAAANYITRLRTSPYVSNTLERFVCDRLQVDLESGVGLVTGQGVDPQIMLDWSDDGGHTWSSELWRSMGSIGEYSKRVIWNRLGYFRQRVFRLKVTDPVDVTFIDAYMRLRKLGS